MFLVIGSGKLFTKESFSEIIIIVILKADRKEIDLWNHELSLLDAPALFDWAIEKFGKGVVKSTSFGLQSAVMLHLIRQAQANIPVIFVDTGYLLRATYEYANVLQDELAFKANVYSSKMSPAFQEQSYGKLWEQGSEGMAKYNFLNKREPMDRALSDFSATLSMAGLRKSQASSRKDLPFIEQKNDIYKFYPILDWEDRTAYQYLLQNNLPYHPLEGMGYDSLGDWHSTKKISEVESKEDTRHGGHGRECGLHADLHDGQDLTV